MKSAPFIRIRSKINSLLAVFVVLSGMFFISFRVNSQTEDKLALEADSNLVSAKKQGSETLKLHGGFKIPSGNLRAQSAGSPRAASAADFNGDGIGDLVVAYSGGLAIYRGDINAFAPQTDAAWQAIHDGRFVSPFKADTRMLSVPVSVDFVQTGDFNRDTHIDIAVAQRGDDALFVLEGDGTANFPNVRRIEVGGAITALASGDVNRLDGLPDLIVGVSKQSGAELQIFQGLDDVFKIAPQIELLPAPAESIAVGQLNQDSFADIAAAAGGEAIILSGKDSAQTEGGEAVSANVRLAQASGVKAIVAGDFLPDRDARIELAALSADGTIRIFARGSLDTRPISKNEHLAEQVREAQAKGYPVPQRILRRLTKADLRKPLARPQGDTATWAQAETLTTAAPNLRLSAQTMLTTGRISGGAADDLIALDQSGGKVLVMPFQLDDSKIDVQNTLVSFDGRRAPQEFQTDGSPVAALALKLNYDSEQDLLVLKENGEPSAFVSAPVSIYTVTTAVDDIDNNLGNDVCGGPSGCTLRAAIMEANRHPGLDTIMINAGVNPTISRGQPDNDAQGTNDQSTGDLDITCVITTPSTGDCDLPLATNSNNLVIMGAAGGNTVSAGTFTAYPTNTGSINTDRVFDVGESGIFGGHFGGGTGLSATFTNLTIQNGNVREALNTGLGGGNYAEGGGIRYDGFGNGFGTLTLTNSTLNNNQADFAGGGVNQVYGTFSAGGSTFSGNIANAGEGGGVFFGAATSNSNVSITSSTFSANQARQGNVFGTFTANADGGGVRLNTDLNTFNISNTNFTNNIAQQDGGAIKTLNGAATVTGGTMTGNTARRHGGVSYADQDTAGGARFLTFSGSTMQNNLANSDNTIFAGDGSAGDGGAIFRDRGVSNITNCTIGGTGALQPNTATNGGGIAHFFTVDSAAGNTSNQTTVTINGGSINGNIANTDGGGVYFNASLFDVTASTLNIGQTTATAMDSNKAKNNGGGVHVSGAATANLKDTTLRSNQANSDSSGGGDGGAFYQNTGTTTFTGTLNVGGSTFANSAVNGGGISNAAGTLTLPASASITFNTATGNGGGINNAGTINNFSNASLNNNSAANGGGVANGGTMTMTGGTINNNSATTNGGGILATGGTGTFDGVTLTGNTATNGNGARLTGGTTNLNNTISISNNLDIAGGTLNFNSGAKTVGGNFNFSSGAFDGGSSTVNLAGNFAYTGGTFTQGTSTFNFNGTSAQSISNSSSITFNNLTDSNTSAALTANNSFNVNGSLNVNGANAVFTPVAAAVIGGTGTLTGTGTAQVTRTAATADFSSQYTIANKTLANLTVEYKGAAAQIVSALTYSNLKINNASGANLASDTTTVNGTLTLTAGALAVGANTLTINNGTSVGAGSLTSAANGTVNYNQGTNNQAVLSANYGNLTFSNFNKDLTNASIGIAGTFTPGNGTATTTGSTIAFNGAAAQTVPVFNYNNLTLNNAAGANLGGNVTVGGTLALTSGALGVGANTLTLNGAASQTGGTISSAANGTVNYNQQSNGQAVLSGSYGNLTFSNFDKNLTNANISIAGTFTPGSGTATTTGSTITFNGTSAQTIPVFNYNNLTLNNAAGATLGGSVTVGGTLTLQSGTLAVSTNTLTLNGSTAATGGSLSSATGGTVNFNQSSDGQFVPAGSYGNLTFSNFNKTLSSTGTIGIAGTFTPGSATGHTIAGSTINFNGSTAQTIPAFNYFNLTSSSAGARTLASSGTIGVAGAFTPGTNSYTITGSTIDFNGAGAQTIPAFSYHNLTISGNRGGAFVTLINGGTINVAGAFNPTVTNVNINVAGNTFVFNGAGAQTIPNFTFNNLSTAGGGTKTLGNTITVGGNLLINAGTTLDASAGNYTISVFGNWTNNGAFIAQGGLVTFNGNAAQTIGGATSTAFNNLTINNLAAATVSANINTIVNGVLTLTSGNVNVGANTLTVGAAGSAARTSGFVIGNLDKLYSAAGAFTYPVGSAALGYAPVNVTVTAGAGNLAVKAVDGVHPSLPSQANAVKRYWTLAGAGITANMTFNYNAADVLGANEANFRLFKINAPFLTIPPTGSVNAAAHTASVTGISSFSDWAIGFVAPVAASAEMSGRITSESGRGLAKITVMLTGGELTAPRYAITDWFGRYRFEDVPSGQTYVIAPQSRRYQFAPASRAQSLVEDAAGIDFMGARIAP